MLDSGLEDVALEVCGAEPLPTPDVTVGWVWAEPAGRVMGETSRESIPSLVALSAAGVVAGTLADVEAGGSETAAAVSVVVDRGSVRFDAAGCVEVAAVVLG